MRRRRSGLVAALATLALSLASCGGDAGTDPETYLRDAMREAVSIKQERGQFPRGVGDLSVGDYDGVGVVTFVTNNDASALCVQLSVPDAKYSAYSADPGQVTDGACDMERVR
ncbi:hypothetical protein [Micromonospora sp. C32]|uniref:hypothetical protein n=1 Tax=unclassified Micromonospora TaxID=2617518 RepID=UPI001B362E5F|nr:hypothetical protein [Micromonospora sp. C32]MBQ1056358.1 hypothetical protein [Micromonospora sp. C32]